jgi:acyl carrier protein
LSGNTSKTNEKTEKIKDIIIDINNFENVAINKKLDFERKLFEQLDVKSISAFDIIDMLNKLGELSTLINTNITSLQQEIKCDVQQVMSFYNEMKKHK